jgi:hypothetical protein
MEEVPLVSGGTAPIQLWSNTEGAPQDPIAQLAQAEPG